jgi:hypothetical protein
MKLTELRKMVELAQNGTREDKLLVFNYLIDQVELNEQLNFGERKLLSALRDELLNENCLLQKSD